jgi:NADH-quinone oxidoreductase subunit J
MILIVVYVGAVAVLFLFVVMMLDINFAEMREGFLQYLPIGALIGIILAAELILVFGSWVVSPESANVLAAPSLPADGVTNTHALGRLIYTDYILLFQSAGLVLLVAMIGAIVLTLRHRPGVRRQKISDQVERRREDVIEIRDVTTGSGV